MFLHPSEPGDDSPPIWRRREVWLRAGAANVLFPEFEANAIVLDAADTRTPASNLYVLQMGAQSSLSRRGRHIAELIRSVCGFCDTNTDWPGVRRWIPELVSEYFSATPGGFGWYSVVSARRPAQFRKVEAPAICVTQNLVTPVHLAVEDTLERYIPVGNLEGVKFTHAGGPPGRTRMTVLHVPRRVVWSNARFPLVWNYCEQWACRARPGEDDEFLRVGRLPAIPATHYSNLDGTPTRVRETIMLTLNRCCDLRKMYLDYEMLTVEIHPGEGSVLSVRSSSLLLGAGILCASAIEHAGIARILFG